MSLTPGDSIGIIGGGQLGRMIAMAAARLGFRTIVLDPQHDAPATGLAHYRIIAEYDDPLALEELFSETSVVTYEFENVPVEALREAAGERTVYPPPLALEKSQDRLAEKEFLRDIGAETAPFAVVENAADFNILGQMGGRGIVKTRRLGYDGKGQVRVSTDDPESLKAGAALAQETPCILEGFVEFALEISVIIARAADGKTAAYEHAHNVHRDGILRTSTLPAPVGQETREKAIEIAGKLVTELDYVGVAGIEFFVVSDGSVLVNEFAPRVHNSGHWTEAACAVSQFEQHVRAIAGLPLADPVRHSDCIMENLIGHDMDRLPEILGESGARLHVYGKSETREGRKMGHVTRLLPRSR